MSVSKIINQLKWLLQETQGAVSVNGLMRTISSVVTADQRAKL